MRKNETVGEKLIRLWLKSDTEDINSFFINLKNKYKVDDVFISLEKDKNFKEMMIQLKSFQRDILEKEKLHEKILNSKEYLDLFKKEKDIFINNYISYNINKCNSHYKFNKYILFYKKYYEDYSKFTEKQISFIERNMVYSLKQEKRYFSIIEQIEKHVFITILNKYEKNKGV